MSQEVLNTPVYDDLTQEEIEAYIRFLYRKNGDTVFGQCSTTQLLKEEFNIVARPIQVITAIGNIYFEVQKKVAKNLEELNNSESTDEMSFEFLKPDLKLSDKQYEDWCGDISSFD